MANLKLPTYGLLIEDIGTVLEQGRRQAYHAVNSILVRTYWEIGKRIIEYEQKGKQKAEYGSALLDTLSKDLKLRYGKGFSKSNIYLMRLFYLKYPKFQTVPGKLSWSHYSELLSIEDDLARQFYETQCYLDKWSIRELKRQIDSALFYRIALSKDKSHILKLARSGQTIEAPADIVKNPYILEFLNLPEDSKYSEKELEQKIVDNLQRFLLELGKGFTFVARQFRITLGNTHFYVDLVFYHRILKCFVLIDLKIGKVDHLDVGQMNLYLNYFKKEENSPEDGNPIGILLGTDKDKLTIEYALGGLQNKLFVSKYKLYLPDKAELKQQLSSLLMKN